VKLTDEAMELLIVAELALELVKERPMPPGLPPRKLARVGATAGCPTVTDDGGCATSTRMLFKGKDKNNNKKIRKWRIEAILRDIASIQESI
jgi:hypothetical protein